MKRTYLFHIARIAAIAFVALAWKCGGGGGGY